jgi:hypothetical protein
MLLTYAAQCYSDIVRYEFELTALPACRSPISAMHQWRFLLAEKLRTERITLQQAREREW